MPALDIYANLTLSQGLFGITKQLPYVGTRQPLETLVSATGETPAQDSAGLCDPVD